jgi:hypothetical protein
MDISKRDYIWLERNTVINSYCEKIEDVDKTGLALKVYRAHHIEKLYDILADYKLDLHKDSDNLLYVRVKGQTLDDLWNESVKHGGDLILDTKDCRAFYVPVDKEKYKRIVRRSSAKMLTGLSTRKKLDILFGLSQDIFYSEHAEIQHEKFMEKNMGKILSLMMMKFPKKFVDDEKRKMRLVAADVAKIPNIKNVLDNFETLSLEEKKLLMDNVIEITAKYNRINKPNVYFLTTEQINENLEIAEWMETDAYASLDNVCFDESKVNKYSGLKCITLALHETWHVGQNFGDFSKYENVEDMLSEKLKYLEECSETYSLTANELLAYNMENLFMEEVIKRTKANVKDKDIEDLKLGYDISSQYVAKALSRSY